MKNILNHLATDWYKYLLELIVITAGVVGAFALNNWNNNIAELKKEQLILKGLKKNYVSNLAELKENQEYTKKAYDASSQLLALMSNKERSYSIPELDTLIGNLINYQTYDPSTGIVDDIIGGAQLNLIRNLTLKDKISNSSGLMNDTQKDIDIATDHLFGSLIAYLMDKINFNNVPFPAIVLQSNGLAPIQPSVFPQDYSSIMSSLEFENLLYNHGLNLAYILMEYQSIQVQLEASIVLIDKEIE